MTAPGLLQRVDQRIVGSDYAQQVRFPPTPYFPDAESPPEMSQVFLEPPASALGAYLESPMALVSLHR